ncbi:hypothetical protein LTR62_000480 [Meristemomyces frigidus]|uniref:Ankyrin repeat protein n=1 Tax=Meristemomyces frigidus TaxID=1508187 RepID=A0AAN7TGQ3_9PEZI|nr:hypothetical protein LTR62_000480 [Meristemomyces frigidus]
MAGTIDTLLNLVPDHPDRVLTHLQSYPTLASQKDAHGYTLLHAATSYNHADLARALINEYNVEPNIRDEDDETALFNAETVEMAKLLLEVGVQLDAKNSDGLTAEEKLSDEDEQPLVAAFLRREGAASTSTHHGSTSTAATNGNGIHAPPPLPNGIHVNVGTMQQDEAGTEPHPEFRRRIEELAARDDFETEDGQRELRNLVQDVVGGIRQEEAEQGQGAATRRRMG